MATRTNAPPRKRARSAAAPARLKLATPPGRPMGAALLFCLRALPLLAARAGIWLGRLVGKPFRLGGVVIAARHADVADALSRDLEFIIQPIDGPRFDQIGYHFILGMDRSVELADERRALYAALAAVDMAGLRARATERVRDRLASLEGAPLDVVGQYARPLAAATASDLFGIAPADQGEFMDVARAIFGHCFMNLANDKQIAERATEAAQVLTGWLNAEIARRKAASDPGQDLMGQLLRHGVNDDLTRRTLGGMLVGSIDTTATVVAKVMTELMADPNVLDAARADSGDPARTFGWCLEALRRWAHAPMLIRRAACDATLGGTSVPSGGTVILWTQAAMLDLSVFPEPQRLRPDRPVDAYLHFGGGLHPCAGRGINSWQIPLLVGALLERRPRPAGPIGWAGPFPAHLPIELQGSAG